MTPDPAMTETVEAVAEAINEAWPHTFNDGFQNEVAAVAVAAARVPLTESVRSWVADAILIRRDELAAILRPGMQRRFRFMGLEESARIARPIHAHVRTRDTGHQPEKAAGESTARLDLKQAREHLSSLLFAEEQQGNAVLYKNPTNSHLTGYLMGLQRARDIVNGEGPAVDGKEMTSGK